MRLFIFLISLIFFLPAPLIAHEAESIKVVVVGDTGIGERGYHPGFEAVQNAMRTEKADAILHLGDFVYLNWSLLKSHSCPDHFIDEIRDTLVQPYPIRIFVAGDNDLPAESNCWHKIAPMATPFDNSSNSKGAPQGVMHLGNTLFVVLNVFEWKDPTSWLRPLIQEARRTGQWVIFALHTPALTTTWYKEKRQTVLKQINALHPDLVFAGNQHSYERFHPMGLPKDDGTLPVIKQSEYTKGAGVTHIVAGGGGATFKPFEGRPVPDTVLQARAKHALMFHYLTLDISHDTLTAKTHRVCPPKPAKGEKQNPRWHADDQELWKNVELECDGKATGVAVFDQIEIQSTANSTKDTQ
jgi:predicted phosphodiesterase